MTTGEAVAIRMRRLNPDAVDRADMLSLNEQSREYRFDMIMHKKDPTTPVLDNFSRLGDCPYLIESDFNAWMKIRGEMVKCQDLIDNFEQLVNNICEYAIRHKKKNRSLVDNTQLISCVRIVTSQSYEDIKPEDRSETAMIILNFIIPASGRTRAQSSTLDQLILRFENVPLEQVKEQVSKRTDGNKQPVLVKLVTEGVEAFYIAFDGTLVLTRGADAPKALMLLFCCFWIFWLDYPVALRPFYKFLENIMGMVKVSEPTSALLIFIGKLRRIFDVVQQPEIGDGDELHDVEA